MIKQKQEFHYKKSSKDILNAFQYILSNIKNLLKIFQIRQFPCKLIIIQHAFFEIAKNRASYV
jgi:hypothetical protein